MHPVYPWARDRPARNRNPGDLRPRSRAPGWPGEAAVDHLAGGPFSIFASNADGWCALGLWTLYAHDFMGLRTARAMVGVFAPPSENDTGAYIAGIEARVGTAPLDPHDARVRSLLCLSIARWEDSRIPLAQAECDAGMALCAQRWPAFSAAVRSGSLSPPQAPAPAQAADGADALNLAELAKLGERPA